MHLKHRANMFLIKESITEKVPVSAINSMRCTSWTFRSEHVEYVRMFLKCDSRYKLTIKYIGHVIFCQLLTCSFSGNLTALPQPGFGHHLIDGFVATNEFKSKCKYFLAVSFETRLSINSTGTRKEQPKAGHVT